VCVEEVTVLIACWSAKGGAGTTVVASALALVLAAREPSGAVLADLAGDVPATLGLAEADIRSRGLAGWLEAGDGVPADALHRLETAASPGLVVLPRGHGELGAERAGVLAELLQRSPRPVVADCGTRPGGAAATLARAATH
jgi:Mrp family chromosome partitioning ATPase